MGINFSDISNTSRVGQLVRLPLKLLPRDLVVPVLQGPLAGRRWIVGASTHGCWLGTYEYNKQRRFADYARRASAIWDIGAHVGLFSLVASRAVQHAGRVFSFEPLPRNLRYLQCHLAINAVNNVSVLPYAVSDVSGTRRFRSAASSLEGSIAEDGNTSVHVVSIDDVVGSRLAAPPDLLKVDVEGAEAHVLKGGAETIARNKPVIFLATHGPTSHAQCVEWLTSNSYRLDQLASNELIAEPAARR